MRRMPWGPNRPALVSEWWAADQRCLTQASCSLPDRVLILRYEDVVSASRRVKERLARFLGIEAHTRMLGRSSVLYSMPASGGCVGRSNP